LGDFVLTNHPSGFSVHLTIYRSISNILADLPGIICHTNDDSISALTRENIAADLKQLSRQINKLD